MNYGWHIKYSFLKFVGEMRMDKFIWCVRLAKTRTVATDLCNRSHVLVNNEDQKPSKSVSVGDIIAIRMAPIWRTYEVLDIPKSRIGAKLVADFIAERTSDEDLEQLELMRKTNQQNRLLGSIGRPTKKDRRTLDQFNIRDEE